LFKGLLKYKLLIWGGLTIGLVGGGNSLGPIQTCKC
jgi:hypothetical protein